MKKKNQTNQQKQNSQKQQNSDITDFNSNATQKALSELLASGDPNFSSVKIFRPEKKKITQKKNFELVSPYQPAGDQPKAIEKLVNNITNNEQNQVLLGVTGSGKTYTIAQTIHRVQRPALILAHNKTLAAQLWSEFKLLFPHNAIEYFVSYYDYFQPEAYVPRSDTYIAKDASINETIDRLRHAATRNILERNDVIIVSSVSCLYGIGSVETYSASTLKATVGKSMELENLIHTLIEFQYKRNDISLCRGHFRVKGDILEIFPAHYDDRAWRISFFDDEIESIDEFDPLTGEIFIHLPEVTIYANSHYATPRPTVTQAVEKIKNELQQRIKQLSQENRIVEAQRLQQKTAFDIEMMLATGTCQSIENYSRYLTGRNPGEPPPTLFEYLPDNALMFVDESHVTVPQIRAMYKGDFSRKATLAEYGFRLASCLDNRPLRFEEWNHIRPQTIFVSATPSLFELEESMNLKISQNNNLNKNKKNLAEQAKQKNKLRTELLKQKHPNVAELIIRPTGLIDPPIIIKPAESQVQDLLEQIKVKKQKQLRTLVTTLTKRMAEDLTEYLFDNGVKVQYLHSDIDTVERIEIIRNLRTGTIDVLVGINLLREGLDIPECGLVAIFDADKEGFLRSDVSLIQTIGRAARNSESEAILYADNITESMKRAIAESQRRRQKQQQHNEKYNIQPQTTSREIDTSLLELYQKNNSKNKGKNKNTTFQKYNPNNIDNINKQIKQLEKEMLNLAENLEFEEAAKKRDEIKSLSQMYLEI